MATTATLRTTLYAETLSFQASMRQAAQVANQNLGAIQAQVAKTSETLRSLSSVAAGFVGFEAIKEGISSLLEAQVAAQRIHYSLLSATGSAAAANQAYGQVAQIANTLGLNLQTAETGFSQMSAAAAANGVSMKDQIALFDGLARSSTVLHLSQEQTSAAILALSQMFGTGKIQAQELHQQLGNAIPGVVPRFQQAVMQMTAGTALAGKSFDQLLQAGDLSVSQFLPALTQALNATGTGAEQAAGGLNAQMNRLSTAWFNLKTDLGSGLLSDAATNGIGVLASNLTHLADAAGVAAGLVAARYAGQGASAVAGSATSYVQQQQAAQAAAAADLERTQAASALAAEQIRVNEAAIAGVATVREQALASRQAAEAAYQQALAQNQAAQATLAHQQGAATLSANIRAQRDATLQAAAAQETLARAESNYQTAVATGNSLKRQQIRLEAELVEARSAATTAATAEAAAEARVAAASTGGLLTKGLSSLGTFALGLVGGPWGAAIAAIGGVAYAVYDYNKSADEFRQKTSDQVKALGDLHTQIQTTIADYASLGKNGGLGNALDVMDGAGTQASQIQGQIDQYRTKIQQLQSIMTARDTGPGAGGAAIADWFDSRKIDQYQAAIDKLTPALSEVTGNQAQLQQAMQQTAEAIWGKASPAMDALLKGLDQLGVSTARDYVVRLTVQAHAAELDQARQAITAAIAKFQTDAASLTTAAATDGMNNVQKQQYALRQAVAAANKQGFTPDQQAANVQNLAKAAAPALQAAAQKDAADAAKKSADQAAQALRTQQQAYENLQVSQQGQLQSLQQQLSGTGQVNAAQKALNVMLAGGDAAFRKLTSSQQANAIATQRQIVSLSEQVTAMQRARREAEAMAVVQDNLARLSQQYSQRRQDSLSSIGNGSQAASDQAALTEIQRQYDELQRQAGRDLIKGPDHGGIDQSTYDKETQLYRSSLQQQLADQQAFYAQRNALQGDWLNGAQAAMQDYQYSAGNVASQVQSAWTDMADGMTSALTTFATTGKLSFSSLATSIMTDLVKIEAKMAVSGLMSLLTNSLGVSSAQISSDNSLALTGANSNISSLNNSLFSGISIPFGGGRATGGPTVGGTMYEVAEGGRPELYSSGGRTYLLAGQDGHVTPATRGGSALAAGTGSSGGGVQINIVNNQAGQSSASASSRKGSGGQTIIDVVIDAAKKSIASDISKGQGPVTSAISSRFGLNKGVNA